MRPDRLPGRARPDTLPGWLLAQLMLLAVLVATVFPVRAESVVLTREHALPRLPAGADPGSLTALGGQLVVRAEGAAWALAP
ncbi:hypothetical protein, partial [Luteimonas sp. SDU101]